MPRRTDIEHILVIGSGPIVIGHACEFDYSGTQACRVLRAEGFRVSLVNSNPATIMTDPEFADATYIEPLTPEFVERVIAKERPDALLPTMGGQTALNTALDLDREGILAKFNVEMIAASREAIDMAEDRELFRDAMRDIGLECPRSLLAHSMEEALQLQPQIGFPCVIRPSFTMGGSGGGIAYNREEFEAIVTRGLDASPTRELLLEDFIRLLADGAHRRHSPSSVTRPPPSRPRWTTPRWRLVHALDRRQHAGRRRRTLQASWRARRSASCR